ncbi:MAG: PEP-CTERM sorting domain-containing protein [Bryobacteraceae bacterium]
MTYLNSGIANGDFSSAFTNANFTSAQTGADASILTVAAPGDSPLPGYYVAPNTTTELENAAWIGTNVNAANPNGGVGDTALYAISFTLPSNFTSASLTLYYAVDNEIGDKNAGIYINGTALPNSTAIAQACTTPPTCPAVNYDQQNSYTDASITTLLHAGTNWLYIDDVNLGLQGGIIFSADINYATSQFTSAPEPASALLIGLGVLGLAFVARRKRAVS